MSDELMKKEDAPKPFRLGAQVGLAAKKKAAQEQKALTSNPTEPVLPPAKMPDRIGIVMDDSGSMAGQPMTDAHTGIVEFLKNCKPTSTAVAVYPMNATPMILCTTLPALATLVQAIRASGSTPALETLIKMLKQEQLTRAIVFSDGAFWNQRMNEAVNLAKEQKVPVDTVFIGPSDETKAIELMTELAERTGGLFLHFIPGKSSFAQSFKYLTPGFRAMLADKSFADKIQGK